jgi:hypothetical protein
METLLTEKQTSIEIKEEELAALREQLKKIETGLATPENEEKTEGSESGDLLELRQLKEQLIETEKSRDDALEKLAESVQSLEEEKAALIRQQEEAEEILRDNMETLREKLESEKQELSDRILEKETEIVRIKKDMDELRDNIQVKRQLLKK